MDLSENNISSSFGAALLATALLAVVTPLARPSAKLLLQGGIAVYERWRAGAMAARKWIDNIMEDDAVTPRAPEENNAIRIRGRIEHHVPGRVRLHLAGHRGKPELLACVGKQAIETGLVGFAHTNALTGSLILKFPGELEELLAELAASLSLEILG